MVSENLRWLRGRARRFDLVIVPGAPPPELERYVRGGGRVLVAGTAPPAVADRRDRRPPDARRATGGSTIARALPSLKDTDLLFVDGEYLELAPLERPILTLIPTAMFGPPEKVWSDKVETTVPGLVVRRHGKGRAAYIPWDVGGLYYRHSSQAHRGLDRRRRSIGCCRQERQLTTTRIRWSR